MDADGGPSRGGSVSSSAPPPKRLRASVGGEPGSVSSTGSPSVAFNLHSMRPTSNVRGPRQRSNSRGHSPSPSRSLGSASSSSSGDAEGDAQRRGEDGDKPQLNKPAHSVYHELANRSIFSIAGVMDRERGSEAEESPTNTTVRQKDDPIGLGLLSIDECDSLFQHYFDQLQTCVCLLDPAVHTASYTRQASLELFAAVLTVASKFFRPELYENLLALADRLVSTAIAECVAAIELVQAICILHYWKKPTDGRGWLRLGHAIRLGYQLDLHIPRRGALPTEERAARLALDRERTWISLFCFDSTATQLSDRPSMMHKTPEVGAWIRSIPYPLPSDGQLEFAVKTSVLGSEVRQLQSCKGNYEVLRSGLRRVLEDLHRSHQSLMADDYAVRLTSTSISINNFSTLAVQLLVECTSLAFAPRRHRIGLLHSCVATSLDLLDIVVEGFGRKGIMPMIEDAHSVAVASTVVRLIRFMAYLDSSAKASVLRKLTKGESECGIGARHQAVPALTARTDFSRYRVSRSRAWRSTEPPCLPRSLYPRLARQGTPEPRPITRSNSDTQPTPTESGEHYTHPHGSCRSITWWSLWRRWTGHGIRPRRRRWQCNGERRGQRPRRHRAQNDTRPMVGRSWPVRISGASSTGAARLLGRIPAACWCDELALAVDTWAESECRWGAWCEQREWGQWRTWRAAWRSWGRWGSTTCRPHGPHSLYRDGVGR